jgi:hypothetical protein
MSGSSNFSVESGVKSVSRVVRSPRVSWSAVILGLSGVASSLVGIVSGLVEVMSGLVDVLESAPWTIVRSVPESSPEPVLGFRGLC